MEERPQFSVGYETLGGDVGVVVLVGEIDIYSAPEFKEVLVNGIEGGARAAAGAEEPPSAGAQRGAVGRRSSTPAAPRRA